MGGGCYDKIIYLDLRKKICCKKTLKEGVLNLYVYFKNATAKNIHHSRNYSTLFHCKCILSLTWFIKSGGRFSINCAKLLIKFNVIISSSTIK